jgi:hypothetical protein
MSQVSFGMNVYKRVFTVYSNNGNAVGLGTLRFGFIDVTEAQIGIIIAHLLSATFGNEFWTYSVREIKINLPN